MLKSHLNDLRAVSPRVAEFPTRPKSEAPYWGEGWSAPHFPANEPRKHYRNLVRTLRVLELKTSQHNDSSRQVLGRWFVEWQRLKADAQSTAKFGLNSDDGQLKGTVWVGFVNGGVGELRTSDYVFKKQVLLTSPST
jgi:hypothetical protein